MRVLFVINYSIVEPLAAPYLSAVLKGRGHTVDLVRVPKDNVMWKVLSWKPDIVGFSFTTGTHLTMYDLARRMGNLGISRPLLVGGGPHCTYMPEEAIRSPLDAICLYEGEESILDMLDRVRMEPHPHIDGFVDGMWVKAPNGDVVMSNPRKLPDVNRIPFPDRSILYKYDEHRNNPIKNVIASRGCPFDCAFCWNGRAVEQYGRKIFRLRHVDSVVDEVNQVRSCWPTRMIFFEDDFFGASVAWLRSFAAKYAKDAGRFPYHAQVRPGYISDERVALMKDSGCVSVTMAPECGDEILREKLLNKKISDQSIYCAAGILHKYRIPFRTENMLGLPTTTWREDLKTLDMNIKMKPECAWSSIYTPYVGTPLAQRAIDAGEYDRGQVDDIPKSFFEHTVLGFPKWRKRGVNNLQKLFGIIVDHPWIRTPAVKVLVFLPLGKLYMMMYRSWKEKSYRRNLFKAAYGHRRDKSGN